MTVDQLIAQLQKIKNDGNGGVDVIIFESGGEEPNDVCRAVLSEVENDQWNSIGMHQGSKFVYLSY